MQKYILLSFCALLLFGCGQDDPITLPLQQNSVQTESGNLQRTFGIKDSKWTSSFPNGWNFVNPPAANTPTVLLAQNNTGSFVVIQKTSDIQAPSVTDFVEQTKSDFHSFQLISESENQWSFSGQLSPEDPVRNFYQKIELIAGTNNYLYGSCSHEITQDLSADCTSILNNWKTTLE